MNEETPQAVQGDKPRGGCFNKTFFIALLIALLLLGAGAYVLVKKRLTQRILFDLSSSAADERALREAFELRAVLTRYLETKDLVSTLEAATSIVPASRIAALKISKVVSQDERSRRSTALLSFSRSGGGGGGGYRYDDENYLISGKSRPANFSQRLYANPLSSEELARLRSGPFGSAISKITPQGEVHLKSIDREADSLTLKSEKGDLEFEICLLLDEPR